MTRNGYIALLTCFAGLAIIGLLVLVGGSLPWLRPTVRLQCNELSQISGVAPFRNRTERPIEIQDCMLGLARVERHGIWVEVFPPRGEPVVPVRWFTQDEAVQQYAEEEGRYFGVDSYARGARERRLARQPSRASRVTVHGRAVVRGGQGAHGDELIIRPFRPSPSIPLIGVLLLLLGTLLTLWLVRKQRRWLAVQRAWERRHGIQTAGEVEPAAF